MIKFSNEKLNVTVFFRDCSRVTYSHNSNSQFVTIDGFPFELINFDGYQAYELKEKTK